MSRIVLLMLRNVYVDLHETFHRSTQQTDDKFGARALFFFLGVGGRLHDAVVALLRIFFFFLGTLTNLFFLSLI